MVWLNDLIRNPFLITAVSSWALAQVIKTVIHALLYKKLDWKRLFGDGGMPSGHSATVASLATICALISGTGSAAFAISAVLAIIVCHDAMGVRLETGKQAIVINDLLSAVGEMIKDPSFAETKLKEFVGHTPIQVVAGILLGIANALAMYKWIL